MTKNIISIPAGHFKARCLQLMDEVHDKHISIVITKHGKPVAMLSAINNTPIDTFGCLKGSVTFKDDIIEPIDVEWDANK